LGVNAPAATLELATALVVLPGPRAAVADGAASQPIRPPDARDLLERGPVLLAHAAMTARRLGLHAPPRSPRIYDALELFAFVRPAQFCAPSARDWPRRSVCPSPGGRRRRPQP